jgi:ribosome modulation factor
MSDQITQADVLTRDNHTDDVHSTYKEGYRAFCDNVAFECCPYAPGRLSYSEWARGWLDAEGDRYGD